MRKYIAIYLDTDTSGDDLRDSGDNNVSAGWYVYSWPLDGNDPTGPFDSEQLAVEYALDELTEAECAAHETSQAV